MKDLITILGPTATGKTNLATNLANKVHGEIISADSRQVFRKMDIGTGKDLDEYNIGGHKVPYHLIDIKNPGDEYSLYSFLTDYKSSVELILDNGNIPILCGGTTLYLEAVLRNYTLSNVPENFVLPNEYLNLPHEEIVVKLKEFSSLHNTTDILNTERAVEALRIAYYENKHPEDRLILPEMNHKVFGIKLPPDHIKKKITLRLKERLKSGMIEEAQELLDSGVTIDQLKYYGLEYKFLAMFLEKEINFNDLFQKLNSAIHDFAKKQMTRYRKMEKEGIEINWIDGELSLEDKLSFIRDQGVVFDG